MLILNLNEFRCCFCAFWWDYRVVTWILVGVLSVLHFTMYLLLNVNNMIENSIIRFLKTIQHVNDQYVCCGLRRDHNFLTRLFIIATVTTVIHLDVLVIKRPCPKQCQRKVTINILLKNIEINSKTCQNEMEYSKQHNGRWLLHLPFSNVGKWDENVLNVQDQFSTGCDHYDDVIMSAIASQITSLTIVYSTVYSGADQSKHQSSASLAFVWGIHRGPVNSPHKWTVTRKMVPFDDVIILLHRHSLVWGT